MPTLARVRTIWSGFPGAPGYTNMFFAGPTTGSLPDANSAASLVSTYWGAVKSILPPDVQIQVQAEQDIVDVATGKMVGTQSSSAQPQVTGAMSGAYSAPTGATQPWPSSTFSNGRRVTARTYLVPLGGGAFEANGTLTSTAITTMFNAASALVADPNTHLAVYTRPKAGVPGSYALCSAATPRDVAAVLRSRRD